MEKIIILTETLNSDPIAAACGSYRVVRPLTVRDMVKALAEEPATLCLIVQSETYDKAFTDLLLSVRDTFPLLDVCVFARDIDTIEHLDSCTYLQTNLTKEELTSSVADYLRSITSRDQRQYQRFSWPLRAWIRDEGEEWHRFRVHSLSAGGAYLEYGKGVPEPGEIRMMRFEFQNCRMTTDAEILDVRRSSSNLPYGFGVKFSGLSPESVDAIDAIVRNALVTKLLDEEEQPEIPSIGEEDITFQFDLS